MEEEYNVSKPFELFLQLVFTSRRNNVNEEYSNPHSSELIITFLKQV